MELLKITGTTSPLIAKGVAAITNSIQNTKLTFLIIIGFDSLTTKIIKGYIADKNLTKIAAMNLLRLINKLPTIYKFIIFSRSKRQNPYTSSLA